MHPSLRRYLLAEYINTRQNKSNKEPQGTTKNIAPQQGACETQQYNEKFVFEAQAPACNSYNKHQNNLIAVAFGTNAGTIKKYQLAHQHGGEDAEALHGREGR